ncbi:MAG: FeoB-associated Cys-rich membrane protein [Clostridia bacterium]|nr:FeoB-associated Cys-rich membrane protein [Clostridia bacterium]
MITWITANIGTVAALIVIAALAVTAVIVLMKDKKSGKSPCGCNCAHCAMSGTCHKSEK